ncbi:MAG: AAA family ATPase [Thaumarchaeota archaeon]|nr:AAA family ATPase [Nitrososphaerota archaeon]
MKIDSIKISNILSFEHKDNLDDCDDISFNKGLNVLIGPNGAGKSNFLEIINQIFSRLFFRQCIFTEEQPQLNQQDPGKYPLTNTLQFPNFPPSSLRQNNNTPAKSMKMIIAIEISESDIKNLQFIQYNINELFRIGTRYCNQNYITPDNITKYVFSHPFVLSFNIIIDPQGNLIIDRNSNDSLFFIIQMYLHWFEYIQKLILIGNLWENKNWEPLKNSFAIISSYRNYDAITTSYPVADANKSRKLAQIREQITNQSIRQSSKNEPIVFQYVKNYLAYEYDRIRNDVADNPQGRNAKQILNEDRILKGINESLYETLEIKLDIDKNPVGHDYLFNFTDKKGKLIQNSEVSAGEKGIIHFIFSIYGFDIENGMLIIDEPELHIHPQIQEKYINIIKKVESSLKLQFIIATHSPIFVTSETIEGIIRFYKDDNGFTHTKKHDSITKDIKDKIQMLTFTNSTKIFFSKKVILVEGDSDHFFLQKYFQSYQLRKQSKSTDIEFLNMGSADRYQKWYDLLKDFKINTYYIGDLDNLLRGNISHNHQKWSQMVGNVLLNTNSSQLESTNPSEHTNMMLEVSEIYSKNIFLLCGGSLEDYFEKIKGVRGNPDRIVNFCNNGFDEWMNTTDNQEIKNELDYFFYCIVRSNNDSLSEL